MSDHEYIPNPDAIRAAVVWIKRNAPFYKGYVPMRSSLAPEWGPCCHDKEGNYIPAHIGAIEHVAYIHGITVEELEAAITVVRVTNILSGE
jgi:hypothetical protein